MAEIPKMGDIVERYGGFEIKDLSGFSMLVLIYHTELNGGFTDLVTWKVPSYSELFAERVECEETAIPKGKKSKKKS